MSEQKVDEAAVDAAPAAEDGKGNREAAKYRTRLRAVEAERDALARRVEAMTRAEVERLVAERLVDPDDLFLIGQADLASLVGEDGAVDEVKVSEAVDALVKRRPYLARDWSPDAEGFDGGVRTSVNSPATSWASVLTGRS